MKSILNRRSALAAVAILTAGMAATAANAGVAYDTTTTGTQAIAQQYGYNNYYLGDVANLSGGMQQLNTIAVKFGTSYYNANGTAGPGFVYTPNLTLDVYANLADANSRVNALGSVNVNNVNFTNDGIIGAGDAYNFQDEKAVTFDFTSQNITVTPSFVFAYHDAPTTGASPDGANGFSVSLTLGNASVGTAGKSLFETYPNGSPTVLTTYAGYSIAATITTSAVPLPSGVLAGGALMAGLGIMRPRRA